MIVVAAFVCTATTKPQTSRTTGSLAKNGLSSLPSIQSDGGAGLLNINNMSVWVRRDGWSGRDPATGNAGIIYPRGTAAAVFQDGIIWSGKVNDTRSPHWPQYRTGGGTYTVGTVQGWIAIPGTATTAPLAIDRNHTRARIYKIRRDWQDLEWNDAEVIREAAEFQRVPLGSVTQQMAQELIDRYSLDWHEWPGDLGAPYYDLNGNGAWNVGIDKPGLQNADQVIWFVTNDLDTGRTAGLNGSPPLGLELQTTLWGYKADGSFGQTIYRRTRFINKSGFDIDSMYVAQWTDSDLGNSGDDFCGSDTTLGMAFVYNSDSVDLEYNKFHLLPASLGYVLLQGPCMQTGNLQDTALFDFRKIPGATNREMTASTSTAAASFSDPQFPGLFYWLYLLKGLTPFTGQPFIHPAVSGSTPFWFDGDPFLGLGRLDGIIRQPGDRRFTMSTGPFVIADGDTQEIVIALVGGIRQWGNHLSSFAEMKQNVLQVRALYGRLFDIPGVSSSSLYPSDTTTQLFFRADLREQTAVVSGQIIFTPEVGTEQGFSIQLFDDGVHDDSLAGDGFWANAVVRRNQKYPLRGDLVIAAATESFAFTGLYGSISLRPLPILQNLRVVWENGRQDSWLNHNETVHLGFEVFNPDGVNGIDSLRIMMLAPGNNDRVITYNVNIPPRFTASNSSFYLVVTGQGTGSVQEFSWRVSSDLASAAFASSLPIVAWNPGHLLWDTLNVAAIRGPNENVKAVIADPALLTGHEYVLTFFPDGSDMRWKLYDQTTGQLKYENGIVDPPPDYAHPIIDGVQYLMEAPLPEVVDFLCTADARGTYMIPYYAAFRFNSSGFPSAMYPQALSGNGYDRPFPNAGGAQWGIHTGANGIGGDYRYSMFTRRVFPGDNILRLVPYDFELRFTTSGGKGWLALTTNNMINVPFELWNIGRGTPNDPSDDHRMIPWLLDANGNGLFDLDRFDHPISGGDNDPETDWIYWYEPFDKSPGAAGYLNEFVNRGTSYDGTDGNGHAHEAVMARMVLVNYNGGSISNTNWPANVNQQMCENGMVFRIVSTKVNIPGDSLRIVAPARDLGIPFFIYLDQNYPNPFNPLTTIRFGLTSRANVELHVFNILGQRVRTIMNGEMQQGVHVAQWDSKNDAGRTVASGVYFYRLKVGELFIQTRKMLLLR